MTYHQLKSELGRRGGVKSAKIRRAKRDEKRREDNRVWPLCPDCGAHTHMGICVSCQS